MRYIFGLFCLALSLVAASAAPLYTYDLTYVHKLNQSDPVECRRIWDEMRFVTSVQGLVNRGGARLYVYLVGGEDGATDRFWLERLRADGEWLAGRPLKPIDGIDALVRQFRSSINGVVVYDEAVPATSNAASTAAGVVGLACVRYDSREGSLYHRLVVDPKGPRLPVKVWLVKPDGSSLFTGSGMIPGTKTHSTGSAKCDAYIWAKEKFLDTGKCDPTEMAYYMDAYWLKTPWGYAPLGSAANHDYGIGKRAFFFDLSPWDDEKPIDDPNQPMGADYRTLCAILRSAYNRSNGKSMIHISGFVPWERKYSDQAGGKRWAVEAEWRYAEVISCFNGFMDADAFAYNMMANASVFSQYPLKSRYAQKLPSLADLRRKGYVLPDGSVARKTFISIYVGDYDAAAWMYNGVPMFWDDPARGTIPLGWGFNPNLAQRFAAGMAYARKTASANDFFVAGDSGAGYVNPQLLVPPRKHSGLPSALDAWTAHCKRWYGQWGLSLTGFVIDGNAPQMDSSVMDAYASFSPSGVVAMKSDRLALHNGVPFTRMEYDLDIGHSVDQDAPVMIEKSGRETPEFAIYRSIYWSPTKIKDLMDRVKASPVGGRVEFVDPYTLMLLIKQFKTTGQKAERLSDDLWDIGCGAEVTGSSALRSGSDARDIFGGEFGSGEKGVVLFADGSPEPNWVEWRTAKPVRLTGFKLYATGDGGGRASMREFGRFRLYARRTESDEWTLVDDFSPSHPYSLEVAGTFRVRSRTLATPVVGRFFRAEFDGFDAPGEPGLGPRVIELDGFGSYVE